MDEKYRDRLMADVMAAILGASYDDAAGVPILKTGEVFDAIVTVMAGILTTSAETSSPTKIRQTSDHFSRVLNRRITAMKSAGGLPFVDAASFHASSSRDMTH